jgi:hypothetical protein
MSKIIVSYRRSDSQAASGRIVDRLIAHYGEHWVFMDIDNIPYGTDFRQHIGSALSQADVVLAVVGPDWLGAGADGRSRMMDDDDPVRIEVETALREKVLVIPVLVNGAAMPKPAALPDSLKEFSFLNAATVDVGRDFHPHVDRLIQSIDEVLARKSGRPISSAKKAPSPAVQKGTKSSMLLGAIAAVLLIAAGAAAWQFKSSLVPVAAAPPAAAPKQTASNMNSELSAVPNPGAIATAPPPVAVATTSSPPPAQLPAAPQPSAVAAPAVASVAPTAPAVPASADVSRFNGFWLADVSCDKKGDSPAWNNQFLGKIEGGVLRGEFGVAGKPGWTKFDGMIAADGSLQLLQSGLARNDPKSNLNHVPAGTEFSFPFAGRFDASHGSASRVAGRTCHIDFVKQ